MDCSLTDPHSLKTSPDQCAGLQSIYPSAVQIILGTQPVRVPQMRTTTVTSCVFDAAAPNHGRSDQLIEAQYEAMRAYSERIVADVRTEYCHKYTHKRFEELAR
jgi:hypothetical protein